MKLLFSFPLLLLAVGSSRAAELETTAPLTEVTTTTTTVAAAVPFDKTKCQPRAHDVDPLSTASNSQAPETFQVTWNITNGEKVKTVKIDVTRAWSPLGADRFYQLIEDHYFDCAAFFRVVPGFVVQFGLASDPDLTSKWDTNIEDDPVTQSNLKGTLSFATAGAGTRTTQIFINLNDNVNLDRMGFSPFGQIVVEESEDDSSSSLKWIERIANPTPGDSGGADQGALTAKGNVWLLEKYPNVDLIVLG